MLSRLNIQNLRDFFEDHIGNGAVGAVTHVGEAVADHRTGGAEGVVGILQHGDIVFAVTHTDQNLFAQLRQTVQIHHVAIHGCQIQLEVAGVQNGAHGRFDCQTAGVGNGVVDTDAA